MFSSQFLREVGSHEAIHHAEEHGRKRNRAGATNVVAEGSIYRFIPILLCPLSVSVCLASLFDSDAKGMRQGWDMSEQESNIDRRHVQVRHSHCQQLSASAGSFSKPLHRTIPSWPTDLGSVHEHAWSRARVHKGMVSAPCRSSSPMRLRKP